MLLTLGVSEGDVLATIGRRSQGKKDWLDLANQPRG
jgi:hypothetical protein